MPTNLRMFFVLLALALVVGAAACSSDSPRDHRAEHATAPHPVAPPATPEPAATPELPPDGAPLFQFLLAEIPELVDQVPCSCCPFTIGQCYRGACPTSCGPCNQIGRDVYTWHKQGVGNDEIIARVTAKYPRN